jgi:hypothetical protein
MLDNQRLKLEIEKLQRDKELFEIRRDILVLKKTKLECEIQANYPWFVDTLKGPSVTLPEI